MTCKWHIVVDSLGRPVLFLLTSGQPTTPPNALALLDKHEAAQHIADEASNNHAILDHVEAIGAKPIIPKRSRMTRKRAFDPAVIEMRNKIKRTIGGSTISAVSRQATIDCQNTGQTCSSPKSPSGLNVGST